jgi:hypothetical protein
VSVRIGIRDGVLAQKNNRQGLAYYLSIKGDLKRLAVK